MKKFAYFALYFSEGAPIGFIWWALPAILAERGQELSSIAQITAVASIPWSIKFLFSPLIEFLDLKFFKLKYQLILYQLMMGITCFLFGEQLSSGHTENLVPIILLHAIFAAAQDICIDTLAIKNIQKEELGKINGFMQTGMLLGRSLFGGVTMLLVHSLGLESVFLILALAIWSSIVVALFSSFANSQDQAEDFRTYLQSIKIFFLTPLNWLLLLITYMAGYSFEGLAAILSATLVKVGLSASDRSIIYSLYIPIAMATGALIAGVYTDKVPKNRAFIKFLLINILAATSLGLFIDLKHLMLIQLGTIIFYFTIGLHTTSLYAFLMEQTDKKIAAFQFSLLMAMTNFAESNSALLAGNLTEIWSYSPLTLFLAGVSLLVIFPINYFQKIKKPSVSRRPSS